MHNNNFQSVGHVFQNELYDLNLSGNQELDVSPMIEKCSGHCCGNDCVVVSFYETECFIELTTLNLSNVAPLSFTAFQRLAAAAIALRSLSLSGTKFQSHGDSDFLQQQIFKRIEDCEEPGSAYQKYRGFVDLETLELDSCGIQLLPSRLPLKLRVLDLSSNAIQATGVMPASYGNLTMLVLTNNTEFQVEILPEFLEYNNRSREDYEDENFFCPVISSKERGSKVLFDPWFNQYKGCKCFKGYSGILNFTQRICSACEKGTFADEEGWIFARLRLIDGIYFTTHSCKPIVFLLVSVARFF